MSTQNGAMRTVPEQTHAFGKRGHRQLIYIKISWWLEISVVASEGFAKWIEYAVIERL